MNRKGTRDVLHMNSSFSFVCDRCSLCCKDKLIKINPYEILRIACGLGMSTTEFIRKYTRDGGVHLLQKNNGDCCFLAHNGCSVHKDRPFVCRLFPLGRHGDEHGGEDFFLLPLDDSCRLNLGTESTVKEYLQDQEAMVYYHATIRYLELFSLLFQRYEKEIKGYLSTMPQGNPRTEALVPDGMPNLMDIDLTLLSNSNYHAEDLPEDPWERTLLHVHVIEQWMDNRLRGEKRWARTPKMEQSKMESRLPQ